MTISDSLIADLQEADEYVIGVPMHNFSIPSTLKLWIDQVARLGKTFSYGSGGAKGLLSGKKATLIMASGGVYEHGTALAALNFATPYLRAVLGWPLGSPRMLEPAAAMVNLLGRGGAAPRGLDAALAVPGVHVHLYGKRQSRPGRKMGHVTALGASAEDALARAAAAAELLEV